MDRFTRGKIICYIDGVRMEYVRDRNAVLEEEIDDAAGHINDMSIEGRISVV